MNVKAQLLKYKEEPPNLIPFPRATRTYYEEPEHLQYAIEAYFDSLRPNQHRPHHKPPTVPGLAFALGLKDKHEFKNYAKRSDDFDFIVGHALTFIESYKNDMVLQGGPSTTGAILDLKNHHGWSEKVETTTIESPLKDLMNVIEGSVLRPKLDIL